jgi:L-aspartate oxidase
LYAAGETAGGPHGADRLGGNMFVTCQVFGKIAGENAANFSKAHAGIFPEKDKLSENIDNLLHKRIDAIALIKELQNRNQDNLLICRSEDSLQSVLDITQSLKNTLVAAPFQEAINQDAFRLACLITATELMTQAALDRKESRGSHYREDYPEKDAAHNRPNHIKKKQGTTI